MPDKPPDAFLSYTRFDDQHDGGAISEFRRRLANAVRAVSGVPFEIFQDVDGIGLGEHWPGKLDRLLDEVRFFIPILTPSYFTSKACREELGRFLRAEAERGRNDLVLPIYYIECDVLEVDDLRISDVLARTIHERQRQDWRELRFEPFAASSPRRALERLAREIAKARRQVMSGPSQAAAQRNAERAQSVAENSGEDLRARADRNRALLRAALPERMKELLSTLEYDERETPATPPHLPRPRNEHRVKMGRIFRDIDASWCPEMIEVPAGQFMMGSPDSDAEAHTDEKPQHLVRLGHCLAVGRYPVTFEEYDHFCQMTTRQAPEDRGWGRGRRPVINVAWNDAKGYLHWLAGETGQSYRLLTEAEWEYACRAGTTTRYWWGDEIGLENANFGREIERTTEVGAYPANPWGLYDMHGNVWEWVEDGWHGNYEGAADDGSARVQGSTADRVVRGGAWGGHPGLLRATYRVWRLAKVLYDDLGFRVARTLTP